MEILTHERRLTRRCSGPATAAILVLSVRHPQRLQHLNQYPETICEHLCLLVAYSFGAQHLERLFNGHILVPRPEVSNM